MLLNISINSAVSVKSSHLLISRSSGQNNIQKLTSVIQIINSSSHPDMLLLPITLKASAKKLCEFSNKVKNAISFLDIHDGILETVEHILNRTVVYTSRILCLNFDVDLPANYQINGNPKSGELRMWKSLKRFGMAKQKISPNGYRLKKVISRFWPCSVKNSMNLNQLNNNSNTGCRSTLTLTDRRIHTDVDSETLK